MLLNVLIFILLFGLLQGLLLAAVILSRKKAARFHIFLSAYIVVLLLQVMFKVISKAWLLHNQPQPYFLSYYLPYLYGPLIFLFAKCYLQKTGWAWAQSLHFTPFCVYLLFFALTGSDNRVPGIAGWSVQPTVRMALQLASLTVYHLLALTMIKSAAGLDNSNHIFKARVVFMQKFAVLSLFISTCIVIAIYFLYKQYPYYQGLRWVFISLTLFIYWVSYEVLKKPELFRVIQGSGKPIFADYIIPSLKAHHATLKYSNSGLKEDEAMRIACVLQQRMEADKIYLDPSLTIDMLAEKLCCQKHHLSQVLNDKLNRSFNELVNEMRTGEAKRILSNPALDHYKISSVAYDAGFNSLSSFNDIFKKREGITPSRYRVACRHAVEPQSKRV